MNTMIMMISLAVLVSLQNFDQVEAQKIFLGSVNNIAWQAVRYKRHPYKNQLYLLLVTDIHRPHNWRDFEYCSDYLDMYTSKVMCKEVFTKLSLTFEDRLQINQLYVNYRAPYEYFWSQHFKCRGDEDKLIVRWYITRSCARVV